MKRLCILFVIVAVIGGSWVLAQQADDVTLLKEKILDFQNGDPLGIRLFTACTEVRDFGSYIARPDNRIREGDTVVFYFEPKNLFTKREGGSYGIAYTADIVILAENGQEVYAQKDAVSVQESFASPRLDLYGTFKFTFERIVPGKYVVKTVLHDKYKGQTAEAIWPFDVVK